MLKQAITILAALLIATVLAVTFTSYLHPMTVTITDVTVMRVLDGVTLADDEPIDWGMVEPDASYQFDNLTATNTGNVPCNVTLTHDAPPDWIITWTANKTILAVNASMYAPLTLYIPSTVVLGESYSWSCWVTATEA